MFRACTKSEAYALDLSSQNDYGVPGIILMENAALACVDELRRDFDIKKTRFCIFCGKGNNGGDGMAIARQLCIGGASVSVCFVHGLDYSSDAKVNYDILRHFDVDIVDFADTICLDRYDVIIDAIFGIGIRGEIEGSDMDIIRAINESGKYVLSVDVPSGINSDTGGICGICINASKTVTFGAYKLGMLLYPAADYVGDVVVKPISFPDGACTSTVSVTDGEYVKSLLPKRCANTHKGTYGKVLVIAGSRGMSGAAYLASLSAQKSGAGLVTLACPSSINDILESKTTEVMTLPLPDTDGHISEAAIPVLLEYADKSDTILIGPGLGRSEDIKKVVSAVLKHSRVPVIVDADAINAVSEDTDIISECASDIIFTPHTVEFARLTGHNASYIEENRISTTLEFAEENGVVVLLKGSRTVVTNPRLEQYINTTGNAGMATGGSGDVLAGLCASLCARGLECGDAAAAAAYIHGTAGDIAAVRTGQEGLTASDILSALPDAFCRILQLDK